MRQRLDPFTRQYIETALWSTNDESDEQGGEPLDKNYSISDIAPETMKMMIEDCDEFQEQYADLLAASGLDNEKAGHYFWLSRNGHGAGFFDEDLNELQAAAEAYGEFDLYVGDDGLVHGSSEHRSRHVSASRYASPPHAPPHSHVVVRDFNTLEDLIEHAGREGATHVAGADAHTKIYYPRGGQYPYEEAKVWRKGSYWHAEGPGARTGVERLPQSAAPIRHLGRHHAAERTGRARGIYHGTVAQDGDYVLHVDHRGAFVVDRVSRGGTHTTIGSTRGFRAVPEALEAAARDSHTRGRSTGAVFFAHGEEVSQIGHIEGSRFVPGGSDTIASVERFVIDRSPHRHAVREPLGSALTLGKPEKHRSGFGRAQHTVERIPVFDSSGREVGAIQRRYTKNRSIDVMTTHHATRSAVRGYDLGWLQRQEGA
jgi:hypothetical protein